jgi:Fe-S-cluster-containing hydrogenase component 2
MPETFDLSRRNFIVAGSAAIAAPLILKMAGAVPEAAGAEKKEEKATYVIGSGCIGCHFCFYSCPQKAIAWGDDKYEIDQTKCIGCGTCASVCNISAPHRR